MTILRALPKPIRQRLAVWKLERIRRANVASFATQDFIKRREAALRGKRAVSTNNANRPHRA